MIDKIYDQTKVPSVIPLAVRVESLHGTYFYVRPIPKVN